MRPCDLELIVCMADKDGMCPILYPTECCQDRLHNLWHFCTPDGDRHALHERQVWYGQDGLSIVDGTVLGSGKWTVYHSWWYRK